MKNESVLKLYMEGIIDNSRSSKEGTRLPTIQSMKSLVTNSVSGRSVSPKMNQLSSPKNVMPIGN